MKSAFSMTALAIALSAVSSISFAENISTTVFEDICSDKNTEVAFRIDVGQSTEVFFHRSQYVQLEVPMTSHPTTPLFIDALMNAGLNKECAELLVRETPTVSTHHNQLVAMVHFGFDKSSLTSTGKKILASVVDSIKRSQTALSIEGHTDSVGSHAYNLKLGLQRADSVKGYLTASTGKTATLKTISRGETAPVANNTTAAGKAQNRRVELRSLVILQDATSK
ncbi:OmpA family protein [Enterovibrio calviensis]|uniref:OmpA family protein n=1 Tax=Enterovibrio calviensis TaxID=91359 RepID=UPI00048A0B4D|nr:OmpA family protein [Enterovibrio calviensis]